MPDILISKKNGLHPIGSDSIYSWKPITETILNGFFTINHKWIVTHWNSAAEKILGVAAKDILGKNFWEKFAGILPLHFYAVYHQSFLQKTPVHFQEYWEEKGAWFDVILYPNDKSISVSFKSSNYPGGRPLNAAKNLEQTYWGEQMTVLNQLYQFVAEVTSDCLWEWDLRSEELFWIDGGHHRLFGYPIENAVIPQLFWESLLHPDDKSAVLNRLHKIIAERVDTVYDAEYRFKKINGEYAYVHDRAHIIYDTEKSVVRMVGATQDITCRKLAENKLVEERLTRHKEITAAILSAQEKERTDMGKELHDNVNQILGATKLYMELAKTDDENREFLLDKSIGFLMTVIEEIRRLSKNLATPGLHLMGLFESIRILLEDIAAVHALKIKFYRKGLEDEDINESLQLNIFRIIQEQLNNILKHAKASRAAITLSKQPDSIGLSIIDNGQGCDLTKSSGGLGIINIKGRVELYHGSIKIVSSPGRGYSLEVLLPLKQ